MTELVEITLDDAQQQWLNVVPSVGAAISIGCCLFVIITVLRSQYYRSRIYHRIMVGSSIGILITSTGFVWGQAAIPVGTPDIAHARGSIETCTAQGFLVQFRIVLFIYYTGLSIICYINARSLHKNIQQHQHQHYHQNRQQQGQEQHIDTAKDKKSSELGWLEKYVHAICFLYPLVISIYIVSIEGFNPVVRSCELGSLPLGCGGFEEDSLECTRGPQNHVKISWFLNWLPLIILLLLPILIMMVVFCQFRTIPKRKANMTGTSNSNSVSTQISISVAKQSLLYLLAVWWTYIFSSIHAVSVYRNNEYVFWTGMLANTVESLQGLWTLLVYWYFRSSNPEKDPATTSATMTTNKHPTTMAKTDRTTTPRTVTNQDEEEGEETESTEFSNDDRDRRSSSIKIIGKPEYSIFDGSIGNVPSDSPWAQFLLDDGEDEEYAEDCGEYEDGDYDCQIQDHTTSTTS